jgi:hypothetical protein
MIGRVMHNNDVARAGTANDMGDEGSPNVGDKNYDFINPVSLNCRQKLAADFPDSKQAKNRPKASLECIDWLYGRSALADLRE